MELNTARGMLERLGFLFYLILAVASCGLVGVGSIFALLLHEPRPLLYGLAGGLILAVLRQYGYRHWHFRECGDSLEPVSSGPVIGLDEAALEGAEELERLLNALAALDAPDASGKRDVWAVQALRQQVNSLLARDPALRETCAEALSKHPDLG